MAAKLLKGYAGGDLTKKQLNAEVNKLRRRHTTHSSDSRSGVATAEYRKNYDRIFRRSR